MRDNNPKAFSRRTFLRFSAVALAGGAALPLLNACTTASAPPASPAATSPATTPAAAATAAATQPAAATKAPAVTKEATIGFATTTAATKEDEMWRKIADTFAQDNPGQKVNVELVPGSNWEKLRIMVQSDTAKDVMNVSDDDAYLMGDSGKFLTIDDIISGLDRNVVLPATWETFKVKGKHNFVSPTFRTTVAIYNKKLFSDAGITSVPTSWEQAWEWDTFVANMKKVTKDTNNDGQPEVYGFGANYSIAVLWPFSNGGSGPYNADETQSRMAAPDVVEAYQAFSDLIHKEKVMAPNLETKDLYPLFNAGKLGMMYSSGAELAQVTQQVDWDIMPLPKMKKSAPTENFGRPFGVYRGSQNPDVAKKFLGYLLGEKAQKVMVDYGYVVPVNKAASDYFTSLPGKPPTKQLYHEGIKRDIDLANVNPLGEQWVEVFVRRGAREILSGQNQAEPYLKDRSAQMDEFIKKTGWRKP